jgi:hypothetical protein
MSVALRFPEEWGAIEIRIQTNTYDSRQYKPCVLSRGEGSFRKARLGERKSLAVAGYFDGHVEHRQVVQASVDLELSLNRPGDLRPKRRLRSDILPLFKGTLRTLFVLRLSSVSMLISSVAEADQHAPSVQPGITSSGLICSP